ncbi:hypothetical protein QBC39DRAFT_297404 [Podospora conica]|nr:hypothetical protein QBC39DRAFT_297404 [Schizothecium conicum]
MCYLLVELYSVCRCLYYQHAVDRCAAYGRPGHGVQTRTILVGHTCGEHSRGASYSHGSYAAEPDYPDSSYHSMDCCFSWRSPPLRGFAFRAWVDYLYSFRTRPSSVQAPSRLSYLFVGHDRLMSSSAPPDLR